MIFKLKSNLIKNKFFLINKCMNRCFRAQNNELIYKKFINKVSLKSCKDLYNGREALTKWYLRFGPKTGIDLDVEYVDTKPEHRDGPTLVALHGCPGNHMDFTKLIQHFGEQYRVIVPNFPDFSVTHRTNLFWHSAEEKAQLVRDLLKALNVRQIDCLVCHSSALFPTSYLWLKDDKRNNDLNIKSLCLLSNPGPKWFSNPITRLSAATFVNISRIYFIRQYLSKIWSKKMTKLLGLRNQIDDYNRLALLLSTYHLSQTQSIDKRLKKLTELRIPTLSVFSSKDRLFNEEIFYNLFDILDANADNFEVYEEHQNLLIQKATNDHWLKLVDIRSGGHYVFSTHSRLVHKYIEELCERIPNKQLFLGNK